MRYRIQYLVKDERHTTEVDATSPQEAVVKFRHTHVDSSPHANASQVLSVSPDPDACEMSW
ncbi:hypothetical protein LCGC14_1562090 [marine sediment metagenome]|uniref:Uncharacterized protein n=1 Tax=marine sediment metagenome TaxID=412755 RepID=A0A0F9LMW6_9ZZZZ